MIRFCAIVLASMLTLAYLSMGAVQTAEGIKGHRAAQEAALGL